MSAAHAIGVYRRLLWLRLARGRLIWLSVILFLLPVIVTGVLAANGDWGLGFFDKVAESYLTFLVPLTAALLAAPTIADEIEGKTFTFVFARPAPRYTLLVGRLLAAAPALLLAVVICVPLSWLFTQLKYPTEMAASLPHLLRMVTAIALSVLGFFSLAQLFGAVFPKHPFLASLAYFFVVESEVGTSRISLRNLTMTFHLRNLSGLSTAALSPALSAAIVLVLCLAALIVASVLVTRAEYQAE